MKGKGSILILLYIAGHFAVDFACAFLLYRMAHQTIPWYLLLLVYNFCAFALQMPAGIIADRLNRNTLAAAAGCVLVAAAFGLGSLQMMAAVITAGIGNALFHLGGGIDVLNYSKNKAFLLGIYVSPGALGIYLGTLSGRQDILSGSSVVLVLSAVAAFLLIAGYSKGKAFHSDNLAVSYDGISGSRVITAICCLFAVVFLRSFIGMVSNFPWKSDRTWSVMFVCAVVLGKIAGGFAADRLGALKASIISLGLASVLYLFSGNPFAFVSAVFFFNMTMPITLWALAKILGGSKGFAFGILTFGIFLGFVPAYFELIPQISSPYIFAAASLSSLTLMWIGLRKEVMK